MCIANFQNFGRLCEKIRARSLVVSWAWIRKEMVRNTYVQTEWKMRSSALERGDLKSTGKGKLSIHFCGDDQTVEVVLRTIISVNQLRIYGAVADMCDELGCRISDCSERTGELVAQQNPETTVIPTDVMTNEQIASDR